MIFVFGACFVSAARGSPGGHPGFAGGESRSTPIVSLWPVNARPRLRSTMQNEIRSETRDGPSPNGTSRHERSLLDIIDTVREPLLVLDSSLRVTHANDSFLRTFQVAREHTIGEVLFTLDDGAWDIPPLRDLLRNRLSADRELFDIDIEHVFPRLGRKTVLLNARLVTHHTDAPTAILLSIEDATMQRLTETRLATRRRELERSHAALNEFACVASHGMCTITVSDNGIGFKQEQEERIFRMFERLHTRTEFQGSGMGLTICQKIVERHGGSIAATSSIGHGATFTITFPVTQSGMPKMDGREAPRRIKGDVTLHDIPVVVLTNSNSDADVIRSYRLGVNSFITKPVTFSGLVEAMNVLGRYWLEIVALPPRPV